MHQENSAKFSELLKPHYNDALRYSRALCAGWSPDDAEDVLQQSFLLALENFTSLRDTSKFRSWFFKIITTTFYSSVRRHFWKKFLPADNLSQGIENMPEVFSRSDRFADRMVLDKALSKLTAKERSAILLFEVAEFSIEEIMEIQKENSLSAVKSRLSRTREKLRTLIADEENSTSRKKSSSARSNNLVDGSYDAEADIEHQTLNLINEIRTER